MNSDGDERTDMCGKIWQRLTRLRSKLNTIPGGELAKQFISLYDNTNNSFTNIETHSEVFLFFRILRFFFKKIKMSKKPKDIRVTLKRRIQMWTDGLLEDLIKEAEQCDIKLPKSSGKMSEEEETKNFSS